MRLYDFLTPVGTGLMYAHGGYYQDENYEWNWTEGYDWLLESVQSYVLPWEGSEHPSYRAVSDDHALGRKGKCADGLAQQY